MRTKQQDMQERIQHHLLECGPQTTAALFARFGAGVVSENGFAQRLWRAKCAGYIRLTSGNGMPGVWTAEEAQERPAAPVIREYVPGEPTPPRTYDVMRAPVLAHHSMQPARPGAANHTLYASRRGDALVPHQQPIHMCSGLKGGMQ